MSKLKNSLPEDIDISDPRDISGSIPDEPAQPSETDFAMNELYHAIRTLERNMSSISPFADELSKYTFQLARLANMARVPF